MRHRERRNREATNKRENKQRGYVFKKRARETPVVYPYPSNGWAEIMVPHVKDQNRTERS